MKIKFWTSKHFALVLIISKRYTLAKKIIPIGCDCHPAHMLKTLNLRKDSLPFDWLDTKPLYGLTYVFENIKNNFKFFLSDLKKNDDSKVYASTYKHATFYHYNDLITNKEFQLKLEERSAKFLTFIKEKPCYFLNTITSESLHNEEAMDFFLKSIVDFSSVLKPKDVLIIYIRYDENFEENNKFCNKLILRVKDIKNVTIIQYLRKKEKFGIWGDETEYISLIKRMGIKLYPIFPKIKFVKIK
jgi:hypothetical protein